VSHPDLPVEQAHLDRAYDCLAAMRASTARALAVAADGAAQEADAAVVEAALRRRLRALEVDVPGLAFGRIDHEAGGPVHHIGRRHVEDDGGDVVVLDWRVPAAVPFYRATASDPQGLALRRRYATEGRTVEALFDEDFAALLDGGTDEGVPRAGGVPDPLLADLERARTGSMRDIVATIQAEQDEVIRAPLDECVVVQGGPGTGKTAVGLHRAAFLLYEHRVHLDETGVLVVGPNPTFLRYIAQVLPSLGETAVRQVTVAGLVGRARAEDPTARAAVLGDARMAEVLRRAVAALVSKPDGGAELATSWGVVRIDADELADAVDEVAARGVPSNIGRVALRTRLLRLARADVDRRRGEGVVPAGALEGSLPRDRAFVKVLHGLWPATTAPALMRRLLSNGRALAEASAGVLDDDERALVRRPVARGLADERWTHAEQVALDEAASLLDGATTTYGHIIVDEAQDLTAMALRALARRCPSGSMTVLGDLAQATAPGGQRSWDEALRELASPTGAPVRLVELELGYRVPAPILEVANRLLAEAAPHIRPARSVRTHGPAPVFLAAGGADGADGPAAVAVAAAVERAGRGHSVGVVATPTYAAAVTALLAGHEGVVVLGPTDVKGLEFDVVVVVEPAAVVASLDDGAAGARLLYVALTRAVQELVVVHHETLPAALAG
jgi:DNA helicase IV